MHTANGTLVAGTPTTVTLDEPYSTITVLNRNGLGEIFFRVDGTAPVVGANDNFVVPAAITSVSVHATDEEIGTTIGLVSSAACTYSVTGQ